MTFIQKLNNASAVAGARAGNAEVDERIRKNLPLDAGVAEGWFDTVEVRLESDAKIYWATMRSGNKPNFSLELLRDMQDMQKSVRELFEDVPAGDPAPVKYFVFGSNIPGIFNLGGDLGHFVERIRAGDIESMRHYAYECIRVIHGNVHAFNVPVVTIGLVQGDALGGGLECAMSYDVLVAERSAKMGLPEVLFNLFPGMGAYSLLTRKIGTIGADKLIMSGRVFSAEELHDLGVVDVLAEDGEGEEVVRDYVAQNTRKHNAHIAMYQARRRVSPLAYDELKDIVDIWVEAALRLSEADLRKMSHLTAAQNRRLATVQAVKV